MEPGATQMAFIVGFPSAESSQNQMQVVESPKPIELEEEEEKQRIQEIKNELQNETVGFEPSTLSVRDQRYII